MKKITIFIDLDDTLADTSQKIQTLFNYSNYVINHHPLKKSFSGIFKDYKTWKHIKNNSSFWLDIPLNSYAQEIYQRSKKITPDVKILTALPKIVFAKNTSHFKEAEKSKRIWIKEHFPEIAEKDIIVTHAVEKHLQIQNTIGTAVLIDDSHRNIKRWRQAGGVAIHINHHDPESIQQLFTELDKLA
jgi:5'(3')-deoxyribonucleotidase